MWFEKKKEKKLGKKWISLLHLNEFNLKDGFKNYIVDKIFDALSNDKNVWKKKKYNSTCYINSFCCTVTKLLRMALQKGGNKYVTLTQSHVEQSVEVVMKDLGSEKSPCLGTQLVPSKRHCNQEWRTKFTYWASNLYHLLFIRSKCYIAHHNLLIKVYSSPLQEHFWLIECYVAWSKCHSNLNSHHCN